MRVSVWGNSSPLTRTVSPLSGFAGIVIGCCLLTSCTGSPQNQCQSGLEDADQIAQSLYERLNKKLSQRRPGGSADWARALERIHQAREAESADNFAECIEKIGQARILLKRAESRY